MVRFHRPVATLLLAGTVAGCSSMSGWIPWQKKQEQGLSWTTPDMSKTYGANQISAERGGTIEPRTEMPKPEQQGTMAKMTSAVSKPVKAMTSAFRKKDATETAAAGSAAEPALDSKAGAAGVYVSLARVQEKQGNIAAATEAYERALHADSKNFDALIGYARLMDREGNFPKAVQLYQTAAKLHAAQASVHNDLGLCLSRQGKKAEAQSELAEAVRLKPDRQLYRNNLAKLMVDQGQPQQAFEQLAAVYPPAMAHYNLGYLLQQKNEAFLARQHFVKALELDPTLGDARQWLAMLDGQHMAEAPMRPDANYGAYAPVASGNVAPSNAAPAPIVPQRTAQPRVSMESEFYSPSRY